MMVLLISSLSNIGTVVQIPWKRLKKLPLHLATAYPAANLLLCTVTFFKQSQAEINFILTCYNLTLHTLFFMFYLVVILVIEG